MPSVGEPNIHFESSVGAPGLVIGQIVGVSASRQILVDFPGNVGGPVAAHFVASAIDAEEDDLDAIEEKPVLLFFDPQSESRVVIVGTVHAKLGRRPKEQECVVTGQRDSVTVDGRKIEFDARDEIVMRCGKSSVTLKKDGKIVLKGTKIVSRASQSNRIKGGSVAIN